MAGISETVFRTLCRTKGADIVFTEMVSAEGVFRKGKNTTRLLTFSEQERPIGIQLFGADPAHLAFAAQYVEEHARPECIDLNSGCPVPKVIKKNGGAALLKDQALFEKIVTAMVKAVSTPVTVKIRSGWSLGQWVDVDFARIAEACGAAAIILHPRSKTMMFSGHSFWERIARVKEAVHIPVIGNGDIVTADDAVAMLAQTGCDSVMVGRGAYGNPWLFGQIRAALDGKKVVMPSLKEKLETAQKHLHNYRRAHGDKCAGREMKKHLAWYVRGVPGAMAIRNAIFTAKSAAELAGTLARLMEDTG
jgi:nifR3 family TIM-barrel protein